MAISVENKTSARQTVNVNGIDIHYACIGQGPDIVMVHGAAANLSFWLMRIAPLLARNYRITVYDLRGHGLSAMPRQGYTTRDMAEDLHGLIQELGIQKAHLAGHSLGGAICMHYAILHPEKVTSLNLIDCRILALQPFRDLDDHSYWKNRREELSAKGITITDDTPRVVYAMLEELAQSPKNLTGKSGLLLQNRVWNPNSRLARRWKELVSSTTFAQDIRLITCLTREEIGKVIHPVLLCYGGDSTCLQTCRGLEEILTNHKTVIHPGMGHFYPTTAPELVAQDLREFLSANRRK